MIMKNKNLESNVQFTCVVLALIIQAIVTDSGGSQEKTAVSALIKSFCVTAPISIPVVTTEVIQMINTIVLQSLLIPFILIFVIGDTRKKDANCVRKTYAKCGNHLYMTTPAIAHQHIILNKMLICLYVLERKESKSFT